MLDKILDNVLGTDVHTGFYFSLTIPGIIGGVDAAFQEISGLSKELQVEEVVCGGENRFKYRLPTTTTFQNLVLKRGVTSRFSPLLIWCEATLNHGFSFMNMPIFTYDIIVNLLNDEGEACKSWLFVNAYPVKWSASELNSEKNTVFIETIELAYHYFVPI